MPLADSLEVSSSRGRGRSSEWEPIPWPSRHRVWDLSLRVPQAVAHRSDQRLRSDRLRQHTREVVEVEVASVAPGDDDDWNVAGGVVSGYLAADVLAAKPRQAEIENDGSNRLFFNPLQRIDAVFGGDDRIALEGHHAAVVRAQCSVVFDDQNRRLAACGGHDRSVREFVQSLKLYGCCLYLERSGLAPKIADPTTFAFRASTFAQAEGQCVAEASHIDAAGD